MLRRLEKAWFALDERIATKTDKMDPLVLITGCFQINKCAVEQREKVINENLEPRVQIEMGERC